MKFEFVLYVTLDKERFKCEFESFKKYIENPEVGMEARTKIDLGQLEGISYSAQDELNRVQEVFPEYEMRGHKARYDNPLLARPYQGAVRIRYSNEIIPENSDCEPIKQLLASFILEWDTNCTLQTSGVSMWYGLSGQGKEPFRVSLGRKVAEALGVQIPGSENVPVLRPE